MKKAKLWTKEYIITTFVNFLAALNFYLLMIVISEYAMNVFNSPSSQAGFSASIFVIGALIARLFAGKWIARVGYKKMLCMGVIASIVMTLTYFGVNSVASLLVIRFLHGAAFGITSTSSATIVADIVPKDRRGEGIGYYSLSQTLATAIGPFLGMFLGQHGSYRMIFAACAIASAISVPIAPFLSLRKIELTDEQIKGMRGFKLSNFIEYKAVPISTIALLIYVCYSSIVSFLTVYSKEIHLVDVASFFFIVYAIVVIASRPTVGRIFDKKGENLIMYPAILMFAIGMFLFSQSYYSVVLLLAAAFIGLGLGAIQSSTQAIAVKVTPQHRMGLANSTYFMLADIGMGIGPLLVGLLIPFTGYRGMYAVVAIIALVCIFLYLLLHGRKSYKHTIASGNTRVVQVKRGQRTK